MVRIAHFGDTHIKNLKYHYEYRKAFEEIYQTLREQDVDYIVHAAALKQVPSCEFYPMEAIQTNIFLNVLMLL